MSATDHFSIDDFYYREISELTEAGGWSIDFENKKSFFDNQARKILNVPENYTPTLKKGYRFYAEEHLEKANTLFFECAQGHPFSTQIKMKTYDGDVFWAKAKGIPLKNKKDTIIGIRGVFQNIDKIKTHEVELEQSLKLIEGHNTRL